MEEKPSGFGARLKRERELRGITLGEIARASKISSRMLQAIEEEDFKLLPGGVFNRGFIRSYARCVGLNEDDVINDYLESIREEGAESVDQPAISTAQPARFPSFLVGILIFGVLLVAGVAFLANYYRTTPSPGAPAAPQSRPSEEAAVETVPTVVVNEFSPMPAEEKKEETLPAPITLEIDFGSSTWVSVKADGVPLPPQVYRVGEHKVFTAQTEIDLTVGNAGGFTYRLNRKPGVPLGTPGQVRRALFNAATIPTLQAPEGGPASPPQ